MAIAGLLLGLGEAVRADDQRRATVGMPARIDQLVLPGPELEARPLDDRKTPVVVRITGVFPHGTAHRYDLVWYGLEPGMFDLKDFLRRKDGSTTKDLPALRVEVQAVLPPGQIVPNPLESSPAPAFGGYKALLIAAGVLWVAGLAAILFVGRRKRRHDAAAARRPVTLADRLRPLVERAMAGSIGSAQRAELERILLAYWRGRLHLEDMKPEKAFAVLREHAEAGPLVQRLEEWLHSPAPPQAVNVADLLRPYQHMQAAETV